MKKIITLFMAFALVFVSCETESLDVSNLDSVDAKSKVKKDKSKSDYSNKDLCNVNLLPILPEFVEACTTVKPADASYFLIDIELGDLAGSDIPAWCVDVDLSLNVECFNAEVYSSYDILPDNKFENPQNFDLVNWILNQDFIGQPSPSGGNYTFGDLQWAIWELIDDKNCVSCTYLGDDWSEEKGLEIVDSAVVNGENFEPMAGQNLAIVLIPTNNKQSVIIPYLLACEPEASSCETAFARGTDGNTCFSDTPQGFNRWGWTIGPLNEGDYTYDIWAAAGQCDTSKGELVGTVDVSYNAGDVSVTYNIDPYYTVKETHTYAGNGMFPLNKKGKATVAPGQYSIEENLDGEIYVIAHAVVCK
ncbi:hypothetical protein [uncultured Maribacter sp.]|uniref:hypothetical protein n=1 Tax=uncultured Maribacter sp. TaxID=431308 RepID=UPI002618A2FF|nr:hypothetical protein [uncultured Maribacter sp.]